MRIGRKQLAAGFTRTALVVVIAVVALFGIIVTTCLLETQMKSRSLCCNCNLKQLGTAYRIWANDHNGLFPSEAPGNLGGWSNLLSRADVASYCWVNYGIMSNELGASTLVLVCPADERKPAADFSQFTNNLQLSYFVGVKVDDHWPQGILSGDRNVCPGTNATADFGFSPEDGKGSNVVLAGPACWSQEMHSKRRQGGWGNLLLGDGSAQQADSFYFERNWVKVAQETAEARAGAAAPIGIRLIFP